MEISGGINQLLESLNQIHVTNEADKGLIEEIKEDLRNNEIADAMKKLQVFNSRRENDEDVDEEESEVEEKPKKQGKSKNKESDISEESTYPKELQNDKLERTYLGLLLNNPKSISMYYFVYDECLFDNENFINIYKGVLFTEGAKYSSEQAKRNFNFGKVTKEIMDLKEELKYETDGEFYDFEKVYIELKKLFTLRKKYKSMPIKNIQDKIAEIRNYTLYDSMSVEEVEAAINQVTVTEKFKQAVLNTDTTDFLLKGQNSLTTGLDFPFPILSSVFKGIRKGETMAFAMPSNSGKSRFTINLIANIAFVHKKKVLVISNEMSEEKMKLCLITTILNNPEIQKLHGQDIKKSEGELLEFKFRPDNPKEVKVDENGFVIQEEKETREQFIKRLSKISTEFNKTVKVTEWLNEQSNNCVYFINITDHTNDELKKVITNYYYKEKIEYMFYDTMKTDTQNIGKSEEIKKTATIISNLAQNLNIFIGYTMQLTETTTLPVNLTINDLSESRTVKEVLDTLCLVKQIDNRTLKDYEYSLEEVSDKFYPLKEYKDPDERYYACVVDKNRAGSKPKVVFNLNLAYNRWTELGYLRLKEQK
jgi:dnaB-like helicase C terminal domain